MQNTKKVYTTPALTVHGDASKLTQATNNGPVYDRQNNEILTPTEIENNLILMS